MLFPFNICPVHSLRVLSIFLLATYFSCSLAEGPLSDTIDDATVSESSHHQEQYERDSETGIEVGALIIIGADFRVFYRKLDSPWLFGFRYLDTDDDFVNEATVGLPADESDRQLTTTSGIYVNYLFDHLEDNSFYLSGAINNTKVELRCENDTADDSA